MFVETIQSFIWVQTLNRESRSIFSVWTTCSPKSIFNPVAMEMEPYRSPQPNASLMLQETESIGTLTLCCRSIKESTPKVCKSICRIIRIALENVEAVRGALGSRLGYQST